MRRGDLRGDIVELLAALALAMAQPTGRGICQLTLELILDRSRHPDLPATVIDKLRRPRLAAIMEHSPGLPAMSIKPHAISELVARTGPALVVQNQLEHDSAPPDTTSPQSWTSSLCPP